MKFLYGSQNFGYDTDQSDKDWLELRYPTWEDIANNNKVSLEKKNKDGSITKVKDIRSLLGILYKGNVSDTQILFSVETYDCEDFKWFIENRQKLMKLNMWSTYKTTLGMISAEYNRGRTSKHIIHMKAWYDILEELIFDTEVEFHNSNLRQLRLDLEALSHTKINEIANTILASAETLKGSYEKYYGVIDNQLLHEMETEVVRLLKKNM